MNDKSRPKAAPETPTTKSDFILLPVGSVPPWKCPGPSAGEVVALPFGLCAVLEFRCEARQPNSCLDPCDECLAARQVAS